MSRPTGWIALALTLAAATVPACRFAAAAGAPDGTPPYHRIGVRDYNSFVGNWDDKKFPVLYALIQTPAQYDAVFHPAAVAFGNRAFAPPASLYETEQILVVARVLLAPDDMDRVFSVEEISSTGSTLTVRYRCSDPRSGAGSMVKDFLALRVPKRAYEKVELFEDGKSIGVLMPAQGQWSVPPLSAAPRPPR